MMLQSPHNVTRIKITVNYSQDLSLVLILTFVVTAVVILKGCWQLELSIRSSLPTCEEHASLESYTAELQRTGGIVWWKAKYRDQLTPKPPYFPLQCRSYYRSPTMQKLKCLQNHNSQGIKAQVTRLIWRSIELDPINTQSLNILVKMLYRFDFFSLEFFVNKQ